jgi:YD repeat-containing protein
MRAGTIKKIQYPTGGSSEFDFEANTTWVSFPTSQWTTTLTATAGFDGSSLWSEFSQYFDGTNYKVNFSNSSVGAQALLYIYRQSDNYEMGGWVLEPGQSVNFNLTYPASQYLIKIKKLAAVSGSGATAVFSAWTTQQVQRNEIVGGLRLKTVTDFDGISITNNKITNYNYDSSGRSMGTLFSRPAYVQIIRNDIVRDVGLGNTMNQCGDVFNPGCMPCNGVATYIKSPSSVRPMETTQGNHIGYRQVKVSQNGNGFSIYKYYGSASANVNYGDIAIRSVTTTSCDPYALNYPHSPLPHDFTRGELKSTEVYNESGNILKRTSFDISYNEGFLRIPGFIVVPDITAVPPPNTTAWNPMLATFYEIKTAKKVREYRIDQEYFYGEDGGYTSKEQTTVYMSNNHSKPTAVTEILNFIDTSIARYKYGMDYKPVACVDISICDQSYNTAMINAIIAYNSAKNTCGDYNCKFWAWQYYIKALSDARQAYVTCRQSTQLNYNSCLASAISTAGNELKAIYDLGNNGRNPVIESSMWKAGKLISASFTNYGYSTMPSNGLYPGTFNSLNLSVPSSTFSESYVSGSSLIKDTRYKIETSFKFYNGNLVEISPRSGIKTSYIWGYQNVLPIVKAIGVDFQNLNSAYANVSGNLNLIRSQAALKNANLNTYEYAPLVGITAEFDPNGRKISYEYDKLQRLSIVRDQNNKILKRYCYGYLASSGDCSLY